MSENPSYLIISDVHYGGFSASKNERILADFNRILTHFSADHHTVLVLAGDLFDYWMEYPGGIVPGFGLPVLELIQRRFGGRCVFIPGNHDVWDYGFFSRYGIKNAGEVFHPECIPLKTEVFHGDGRTSGTLNLPLPFLNRTIRSVDFVATYQRKFPPAAGWGIMKAFSKLNHFRARFEFFKTDKVDSAFRKALENQDPEMLFICGHEHIHQLLSIKKSVYLNTGNFSVERSFAYLSPGEVLLQQWKSDMPAPQTLQRFCFS